MKTHRYFTRQPKPERKPGLDFRPIGGVGGFLRYEPFRTQETLAFKDFGGRPWVSRFHRLNCCPVYRGCGDNIIPGFRVDIYNPHHIHIYRHVFNQWSGSSETSFACRITLLQAGNWLLQIGKDSLAFSTLLRAIRYLKANLNTLPVA